MLVIYTANLHVHNSKMFSWLFGKTKEKPSKTPEESIPSEQGRKADKERKRSKKEDEDSSTDSVNYYDTESTSSEEEVKRKRNKKGSRVGHMA